MTRLMLTLWLYSLEFCTQLDDTVDVDPVVVLTSVCRRQGLCSPCGCTHFSL